MAKRLTRKKEAKPLRKRLVESRAPVFMPCGDTLSSMLSAHDRRPEKARLGGKWLHVSALVKGDCLRALRLSNMETATHHEKPRPADRLLWSIGKAVEAHIRSSLIDLYGARSVFGHWRCPCGAMEFDGMGREKHCDVCGMRCFYSEFNIKNEDTLLTGSPDMLLCRRGSDKLTALEIKSIKVGGNSGAPEFNSLESPQRDHVLQVLLYRKLLEMEGFLVTDEALVCYGAKDYVMQSPYKVFTIDGTEEHNESAVDYLIGLAADYAKAVSENRALPRISLCPTCGTSRAKACPMVASCFNRRD